MNFTMVGYGSLVSDNILQQASSNEKLVPVIVKGYKRVFNMDSGRDPNEKQLSVTKQDGHSFNGILFSVDAEQLEKLKKREWGYTLERVMTYNFSSGKEWEECQVFAGMAAYLSSDGIPEKDYFILCRKGAYAISEEFGKYWDQTTYTSQGETISEWIKKNKEFDV